MHLDRLDLLDFDATTRLLDRYRPDVVMHCAAERRLDAFGRDLERPSRINGGSTRHQAKESARLASESSNADEGNVGDSPYMVFVSTDGLTAGMFQMDDAEAGDSIQGGGELCCLFVAADKSNQPLSNISLCVP
jgi:dTDP-4-dehydrorhamnose reductase